MTTKPNLAATLKSEIQRLARKEVRAQVDELKKSLASLRAELGATKKRVKELERSAPRARRKNGTPLATAINDEDASQLRFRADGYVSLRKRLNLTAAEMGRVTGVSEQTVYKRERGAKPRSKAELVAIAKLRGMGKVEVRQLIEKLRAQDK